MLCLRLIALVLLITLPATVLAEGTPLQVTAAGQAAVETQLLSAPVQPTPDLFKVAVADNAPPDLKAEPAKAESRSACSHDFWEIHFGGYRWVWWAAAVGAIVGLHAFAAD